MNILDENNYVNKAARVISDINKESQENKKIKLVTTSKIRNILSMIMDIYNQVNRNREEVLNNDILSQIEYLKVRMIYECGRDDDVKHFMKKAELLKCIKEVGNSKKNYILFSHYVEALVAYRKYVGGDREL